MKIILFIILIMTSLLTYSYGSLPILLSNSTSSIKIINNSIEKFYNSKYSIYCNDIYEGSLYLNGHYNTIVYIINSNVLIIFFKNIKINIKNLTFNNSTPNLVI